MQEVHYWTNRPIWPQGINRPYQAYNPDLGMPTPRDQQLIVTDGRTSTDRDCDSTNQHVELVGRGAAGVAPVT